MIYFINVSFFNTPCRVKSEAKADSTTDDPEHQELAAASARPSSSSSTSPAYPTPPGLSANNLNRVLGEEKPDGNQIEQVGSSENKNQCCQRLGLPAKFGALASRCAPCWVVVRLAKHWATLRGFYPQRPFEAYFLLFQPILKSHWLSRL